MIPPISHSFTLKSNQGILRALITQVHACAAFDHKDIGVVPVPQLTPFQAIWDTGATNSVITQAVVDACSLKPTGMTKVHGVNGESISETFLVNIGLPNGVGFQGVTVTRGDLPHGAQMLIGMDIITCGDFSISNFGGVTIFTFRYPSMVVADYVRDANRQLPPGGIPPKNFPTRKKGKHRR